MNSLDEQVVYIRLEPLTPIHIGTGETLDPLSYVMRMENDVPYLYPIDVAAWVESHPDPAELADFFSKKGLVESRSRLAKELAGLVDVFGGAPVKVHSKEIYNKYETELRQQDSQNQLLIASAMKNSLTGGLFIPGSTIKGAIRTAVIDWLDQNWGMELKKASSNSHNGSIDWKLKEFLGGITNNSFRNLKVSDFQAAAGESCLVQALEVRNDPNSIKNGTPKSDCEVSFSLSMIQKTYAIYGKLLLGSHDAQHRDTVLSVQHKKKSKRWNLSELMALCSQFYWTRYRSDKEKFYNARHLQPTTEALKPIDVLLNQLKPNSMLLRLGHYSHIECVTITDNDPRTPVRKGIRMPSGTTRTLADGVHPFGWAMLTVINAQEYADGCAQREAIDKEISSGRERRRLEFLESRRIEVQKRQEQARLEEERRRAEEETKAKLAAMSPDQRLLHVVQSGQASENQVVELYGKLDSLSDDLRLEAANEIKKYFIKVDKWNPGKCKEKQRQKILKIKSILGES